VLLCETPRLLIRRLDATDAPFVLRLLNEPSFLENIGSIRVLEKLGMTFARTVTSPEGQLSDLYVPK
jgi:hypothetical protein